MNFSIFFLNLNKMSNNFPLYDSILSQLSDADTSTALSVEKKHELIEYVKKSGADIHELFYMLLKVHNVNSGYASQTNLPFNGKEQKTGLKFDLDTLPIILQHILYKFSKIQQSS